MSTLGPELLISRMGKLRPWALPSQRAAGPGVLWARCVEVSWARCAEVSRHTEPPGNPAARGACVTCERLHGDSRLGLVPGSGVRRAAHHMRTWVHMATETMLLSLCAAALCCFKQVEENVPH